jgi:pimeloyl-ACP methyl ester carboxylesterase
MTIEVELIRGRADRPPLVLLHEGLGCVALWRDFPRRVAAATGGPTTLVYSRAGYGRSTPVPLPRPVTYMHEEALHGLPAVLAEHGIDRPILIGHSDGASIAIIHAGAGFPVTALVLMAPHVFVEDRSIDGIRAAKEAYDHGDLRGRLARYHDHVDVAFRGWNDVWLSPEFRTWDITDRLGGITCPVLLVQEEHDAYGTVAQLDAIERGVPGRVERCVVAGTGHSPHLDDPESTLAAVAGFVSAVTLTRGRPDRTADRGATPSG